MQKIKSYLHYIQKERKFLVWIFLAFAILISFVEWTNNAVPKGEESDWYYDLNWWAKSLDPIIGVGVFIMSIIIGWTQLKKGYQESLPKRLTVIFSYNGRQVMLCKKAHLSAVGDIRNLGQQIGGQMAKVRFLDFKANDIESKRFGVEQNEFQEGSYLMHYQVEFELLKLPTDEFKTKNLIWHEPDNTVVDKVEWIDLEEKKE